MTMHVGSRVYRAKWLVCTAVMMGSLALTSCGTNPNPISNIGGPYGDASQGDVDVTATTDLYALIPTLNFQFRNFTVDAGVTLTVPSGTVLRCTGTFSNNGVITVLPGAAGGRAGGLADQTPGAGLS